MFPALPLEAGRVQAVLGVHAVVHGVHHYLHMALGLHEAAHHAEGADGLAILCQKAGNDGVVRALASLQAVVAALVQREVGPPVLQTDGRAGDHHPGAKLHVIALNEGDHVALLVGGAEIHRVPAGRVSGGGVEGGFSDQRPAAGGIAVRQQIADLGAHIPGVGHIGLGIDEGQLHGLNHFVIGVSAVPWAQLHALEDVQGHQGGDTVAVGRHLEHVIALVVDGDGVHPQGRVVFKIRPGEVAAGLPGKGHNPLHQFAPIIALAVRGGQTLQGIGIVRQAEQLPGTVGFAILGEVSQPGGEHCRLLFCRCFEALRLTHPQPVHVQGHREALPGVLDGRSHQFRHGQAAEAAAQRRPGGGSAGHHGGQPAVYRHLLIAHGPHPVCRQGHGGHTGAVEPVQLFVLRTPDQGEAVAAQTVAGGLHQGKGHRHGDGGVHGVAAPLHGVNAHLGGQGHTGAGHALAGKDHVPAGGIGVFAAVKIQHRLQNQ